MINLSYCVYLLLMVRLEKQRGRQRVNSRRYNRRHTARRTAQHLRWVKENPEKAKEIDRRYYHKKRKYICEKAKNSRLENLAERRDKATKRHHSKYSEDPQYRLALLLRNRIRKVLKGFLKSANSLTLLGCSASELRQHLEKQFVLGMTWENYGPSWHVDHIKPCAKFDLTRPEQQRECFHYSNLQPLWATDNLTKGDSWPLP